MHQVQRKGQTRYEDLMQELEVFEHQLLSVDPSMAMSLMVLEAKIRERFQGFENRMWEAYNNLNFEEGATADYLTMEEIRSLIPRDLPNFPTLIDMKALHRKKQTLRTIAQATILAILTSVGVFTVASVLQVVLNWIA